MSCPNVPSFVSWWIPNTGQLQMLQQRRWLDNLKFRFQAVSGCFQLKFICDRKVVFVYLTWMIALAWLLSQNFQAWERHVAVKVLKCWRERETVDKPTRNQNTVVENVFSGFHHCGFLGVFFHISWIYENRRCTSLDGGSQLQLFYRTSPRTTVQWADPFGQKLKLLPTHVGPLHKWQLFQNDFILKWFLS